SLLLHNFADFNLEFYATSFPFFAVLGVLVGLQRERTFSFKLKSPTELALIGGGILVCLLALFPFAYAHRYRGVAKQFSGWQRLSTQDFEDHVKRLLRHRPSDYMVPVHAARYYLEREAWDPQKALQWLDKAQFLNPTAGNLFLLRSYIYARLSIWEEACLNLERAIAHSPRLSADAETVMRRYRLEQRIVQRARSLPLVRSALHHLKGEHAFAFLRTVQRTILQTFPEEYSLLRVFIDAALVESDQLEGTDLEGWKLALKRAERLIWLFRERFPKQTMIRLYYRGMWFEKKGFVERAILFYTKVMEDALHHRPLSQDYWRALFRRMRLHLQKKHDDLIKSLFEQGRQHTREPAYLGELYYLIGRMYQRRYSERKALDVFEQAVRYQPKNPYYWWALADTYTRMGWFDRSTRIYTRYLKKRLHREVAQKKLQQIAELQRTQKVRRAMFRQ
ncbi:MAG: hypothetical protein AAGJ35_09060, partial [Myxococcota bacterium]